MVWFQVLEVEKKGREGIAFKMSNTEYAAKTILVTSWST
jgi:hypothetical protein